MTSSGTCEAMMSEALTLDRQGRISEAIAAYERLLESWPGLPDSWYNLALLQRKTGRFSAALASYKEALEREVRDPEEVHLNRAVIYSDCLHQYEAAQRELEKALVLNPDYIPALMNLANLREDLGRRELAGEIYERILVLAPDAPLALARYAALHTFSDIEDPLIERLRRVLARDDLGTADRASVEFALGRALDACQAYDAAFEIYRAANRHSRESAPPGFRDYDLQREERFIDRVIGAFPMAPPTGSLDIGSLRSSVSPAGPQPIFICGMFRSGSTLTEQLLGGHPRITGGGELDFLARAVQTRLAPFPESMQSLTPSGIAALSADYLGMLREAFPAAAGYVTDKRPDNFLYIGLIKKLFPRAKIVHTTRDALDNCMSIYFLHLDQSMRYALDLMDIGHYYHQYRRVMAHWKALFGADIVEVNYDHLVQAPDPAINQVLDLLGLEWDARCLTVPTAGRAIKPASVWQVREPLYQRASGRSRLYARHLSALRDYLNHQQ